jgi:hypothetical protein
MYGQYTTLSAPCPAKKWSPSMDIRIVLTGPDATFNLSCAISLKYLRQPYRKS